MVKLDNLIYQYNALRSRIEEKKAELDYLRGKIAQELIKHDETKYNGAVYYNVKETKVKSHIRCSYNAIRISQ